MSTILTLRATLLGLASWLVPFIVSFAFVDQTGQPVLPQSLFKSLMVVISGGVGAALLVAAFRRITPSTGNGALLGTYWLAINVLLDVAILLPLANLTFGDYVYDIGLRYLMIPIMSTAIGAVAGRTSQP